MFTSTSFYYTIASHLVSNINHFQIIIMTLGTETTTADDRDTTAASPVEYYASMDPTPPEQTPISTMIEAAIDELSEIHDRLDIIRRLERKDQLKFLSKDTRNNVLNTLEDHIDALEETAKAIVKAVKKVKRARVDEDTLESIIGVPVNMRGVIIGDDTPIESGFDEKGFGEG